MSEDVVVKTPKTPSTTIIYTAIISAILFGALGYWIGGNSEKKEASETTTATTEDTTTIASSATSSATDETASWKTYTNEKYGFSLTVADDWTGYKVFDWKDSNTESPAPADALYSVCLPTNDQRFDLQHQGYACPFKISVYQKAAYDSLNNAALEQGGTPYGTKLGEKNGYVFLRDIWQDSPEDLRAKGVDKEIDSVLSTFQFTK